MTRDELIACFQDTLEKSRGDLAQKTAAAVESNRIYKEGFISNAEKRSEKAPLIVAEAFRQIICERKYYEDFKQIVFAIKSDGEHSTNLKVFSERLCGCVPNTGETSVLITPVEQRLLRSPALPAESRFAGNGDFRSWQIYNRYFGKQFSILGDSISTLDGYNPIGYQVFYSGDKCAEAGVSKMSDTWWDKVISFFGGELLVNNSYSGSRVTKLPGREDLFPSGCSDERTSSLHINGVKPDVILVYLGTNDWAYGARTGYETKILGEDENEEFDAAYNKMLRKLRTNYPHSEIWCCTLCTTFMSGRRDFLFPYTFGGTHIEQYNDIIRKTAAENGCGLLDLYGYGVPYDTIDGSHPNAGGMNTLAALMIRAIAEEDASRFLDCENNSHDYVISETGGDRTRYVCRKCGKEKFGSTVRGQPEQVPAGDSSEYVLLDPGTTAFFSDDTLRLKFEDTGETVSIQKKVVSAGRDAACDLPLKGKKFVARRHAFFFFEREMWFVLDNYSTNGTYLNGVRLLPGKKYQLNPNDRVRFAGDVTVTFENTGEKTGASDILINPKRRGFLGRIFGG